MSYMHERIESKGQTAPTKAENSERTECKEGQKSEDPGYHIRLSWHRKLMTTSPVAAVPRRSSLLPCRSFLRRSNFERCFDLLFLCADPKVLRHREQIDMQQQVEACFGSGTVDLRVKSIGMSTLSSFILARPPLTVLHCALIFPLTSDCDRTGARTQHATVRDILGYCSRRYFQPTLTASSSTSIVPSRSVNPSSA